MGKLENHKHYARKLECEADGVYFNRLFMKQRMNFKMQLGPHHYIMQKALDRTMLPPDHPDHINRLIINVPPGYTKTEMAVIHYMARGLAIDARSRFLHLSYSHALALQNSAAARTTLKSQAYQLMWPILTRDDTDSKSMWWTHDGGGVYATAAGGQVTGFRAGHMDKERFTGALIIDDPVKPDDAYSEKKREAVNNRFNETIQSRVAVESVPIIVIMQRIHHNDLSGYLLRGGSGEYWHHLNMPVKIKSGEPYPEDYKYGIQIPCELDDGWLWPFKHNDANESSLTCHKRKFAAQYMQKPKRANEEQMLWNEKTISDARDGQWLEVYKRRTIVAVDPATTNNETSDEHGIVVCSTYQSNQYSVDGDYTRRGSPLDWATTAIGAYKKYEADAIVIETNQGGDMCESTLRNAGFNGRVIRVHASKGKVARAEPIAALYELSMVKHSGVGLMDVEDEMLDLNPITGKLSDGSSPNRVDALVWGLSELSGGGNINGLLQLAVGK